MDINQTYSGDHFAIYTNIGSLCYTSETNIMFHVNYTSIKKASANIINTSLKANRKSCDWFHKLWLKPAYNQVIVIRAQMTQKHHVESDELLMSSKVSRSVWEVFRPSLEKQTYSSDLAMSRIHLDIWRFFVSIAKYFCIHSFVLLTNNYQVVILYQEL